MIFWLDIVSVIFLILSIVFILKGRRFEDERLFESINLLVFGLFFFLLSLLVNILDGFIGLPSYLNNLIFLPLTAICFFVAMMMLKEI